MEQIENATPSCSSAPTVASTSTANADSSTNCNDSNSKGNKEPKRKSNDNDADHKKIPKKEIKLDAESTKEYESLVNDFNKDLKNESFRKEILVKIQSNYFIFYRKARDYLIRNYSKVEVCEDNNRKIECHVCKKCGTQFKTKLTLLVRHILMNHQLKWPVVDEKVDVKPAVTDVINKITPEATEASTGRELGENLNVNAQNTNEIPTSSGVEENNSSEDLLCVAELEKCYDILNSSPSITKEIIDSQERLILKLKNNSDFLHNLIWDAKKGNFSLILNKHYSDRKSTCILSFTMTYFNNDKIDSQFYRLIEVSPNDIFTDIIKQMEKDGLKYRFKGIGYQVTDYKNTTIESAMLNLKSTIKDHLCQCNEDVSIVINKDIHDSIRAIAGGAYEYISHDVEFLLKETCNWFKLHNEETTNVNLRNQIETASKSINANDVWIFKLDLIKIVLDNWTELKEHFRSVNNPYNRWLVQSFYENNVNEMYLRLIHCSLLPFKKFFEFLNSSSVTKDKCAREIGNIAKELDKIATSEAITTSEVPMQSYQNNKKKFIDSLKSVIITKLLKINNFNTPIPISNKKIETIVRCINESINNTENIDLLETCVKIKFMKING